MNTDLLLEQEKYLSKKLQGCSIMVSGATGLIGSRIIYLIDELNSSYQSDIKVIALYRDEEKKENVFKELSNRHNVVFINHDIEDMLCINQKVDYIIHCAGVSGGSKMHLKNSVRVFDIGLSGTKMLLDFAVKQECQGFLYVSTYEIYGSVSSEELIKETDSCSLDTFTLRNIYAEIKRLCESLCCAYSNQYNLNTYAVRLTSTFGNGVKYDDPRFFAEFARCIIENRDIVLKSTGGTVRSYLDADDAAIAFLYILANGKSSNAYNLTNMENSISIKDIAVKMIELSNSDVQLKFELTDDIASMGFRKESCTLMDAGKIEQLGWKPVYSMEDTLVKLLDSMKLSK